MMQVVNIIFIIPYPQMEQPLKKIVRSYLEENRQKRVKILYIIPYAEQDMQVYEAADTSFLALQDRYIHRLAVNMKKPIDKFISSYIDQLEFEYDVIIARGSLADKLRENKSMVPVIDIPYTGYDVIYSLIECQKKHHPQKIAIIGRKPMISHAKGLEQFLNCSLSIYHAIQSSDVEERVVQAKEDGCDAVIGGYTTTICAEGYGLHAVGFRTGSESVVMAIEEAVRMVEAVRNERELSEIYRTITHVAQDGMIYVDSEKTVQVINRAARQLCGSEVVQTTECSLEELFPYALKRVEVVLGNGKDILNELDRHKDLDILSNYFPIHVKEKVVGVVIQLQNVSKIQATESQVRKKLSDRGLRAKYQFEDVVHRSQIMDQLLVTAEKYAKVSSNILIVGETGTGKELIAQGIHNRSKRRKEPFVAVNCAALAENLLESELFGYASGAFTGASRGGKMGLFELAHNGTIFLDEISEVPLNVQSKLLRVLQEREIRRVGDDKVIPIDVRVIAATNRNLQDMVRHGLFRQDLLYRLNILRLYIPPLRQRKEDIGLLFEGFLQEYCTDYDREPACLLPEALDELKDYDFNGNVRELRNLAERVSVLYSGETVGKKEINEILFPKDIELNVLRQPEQNEMAREPEVELMRRVFEEFQRKKAYIEQELLEQPYGNMRGIHDQMEKGLIEKTLKECENNQGRAAKALGIDRSTLWRKMKKFGL